MLKAELLLVNWMLPLELTLAVVNDAPDNPYNWKPKGKVIPVVQSSQWLPMSCVPGTIEAPVDWYTM